METDFHSRDPDDQENEWKIGDVPKVRGREGDATLYRINGPELI